MEKADLKALANTVAAELDADILFYNSDISWDHRDSLVDTCDGLERRTNVLLILTTNGGDPDAAYRIARTLQRAYKKFILLVPGYCKSAGTLVALGAHEIVMSENGELGPLDVQIYKPDELGEMSSGLSVMEAIDSLKAQSFSMFEEYLISVKGKSGGIVTFKTASQIAADLTSRLFSPVYQQIDPISLGEIGRAMKVAQEYGKRLNSASKNLKDEALEMLVASYPSHGFVIDLQEAQKLFKNIRGLSASEKALTDALKVLTRRQIENWSLVAFISDPKNSAPKSQENANETQNGGADPEGKSKGTGEVVEDAGEAGRKLSIAKF